MKLSQAGLDTAQETVYRCWIVREIYFWKPYFEHKRGMLVGI